MNGLVLLQASAHLVGNRIAILEVTHQQQPSSGLCVSRLREARSFYHAATAPWIVDRYKAIEIDKLSDFIAVEALMKARLEGLLA